MVTRIQKTTIEELVSERIKKTVVKDIESIEIEVWEKTDSGLYLNINKKHVELKVNYKTSTKNLMTWFSSIVAILGSIFTILKWLIPIFIVYFSNSPP